MKGPSASKIVFYRSLQAAMAAGLPARQAVSIMEDECVPSPWVSLSALIFRLGELWGGPRALDFTVSQLTLRDIAARVSEGSLFADAFAAHPKEFPAWETAIVRVAEKTGRADQVFRYNAEVLEWQKVALQAHAAAAAQPMLTLMLVPWIISIPIIVLWGWLAYSAAVILAYLLFTPVGSLLRGMQRAVNLNDTPGFAKMQFARCLAFLIKTGIGADEAIAFSARAAGRQALATVDGETLYARLCRCGMFSREDLALIETGEIAGKLDATLDHVARQAEQAWQASLGYLRTGFQPHPGPKVKDHGL